MSETLKNFALSNILEIALMIISFIITYYVLPYIKNDMIPFLKEKRLYSIVKKFVQGAEKMAESGIIKKTDKKLKVIELLENRGIIVDATIDAFIESCVKELDIVASSIREEIVKTDEK
jgi:predicted rRNA methylase YqxC with S4 and FtsJ domains